MKITLITVGKIKEKYLRDAIAEYSKRLSRYCKLEIIEVADEKTPDHASDVVENTIRDKEAERIMKYVKDPLFSFFRKRKVNIQIRASCPYYFQSKKGTEYAERL